MTKTKYLVLFLALFTHVFVLNLFYVSTHGLVFYWQENLQMTALIVYFLTAASTVVVFSLVNKGRKLYSAKEIQLGDKFWLLSSLVIFVIIGFLTY